jgi:hypothetical protein
MLQLKIPKRRMMKYSSILSLIGSNIPLVHYCLKQLLTENINGPEVRTILQMKDGIPKNYGT